jgi:site-specific DNA-cytosine methylase
MTLRHASFFSGVGGLDLGFHRAGIETVSLAEIDPYASAVLAERFPGVPNLGDITKIKEEDIPNAEIYSGGFPCQDLSVAGRRKGFQDGTRSSLAFTYLDLVERTKPRWILLENVPGLFSSNEGRDFGRLIQEVVDLGYGVAWRTLDARFFGVAQRRRRVFIVAARDEAFGNLGAERAAEVLLECASGCRDHSPSGEAGESSSEASRGRAEGDRGRDGGSGILRSTPHSDGVRALNGVGEGVDDREGLEGAQGSESLGFTKSSFGGYIPTDKGAGTLRAKGGNIGGGSENLAVSTYTHTLTAPTGGGRRDRIPLAVTEKVLTFPSRFGSNANVTEDQAQSFAHSAGALAVYRKSKRAQTSEDDESWVDDGIANTLNSFDVGDTRTTHAVIGTSYDGFNQKVEDDGAHRTLRIGRDSSDFVIAPLQDGGDDLLPVGLDSHRYRCAGNGVVANVAEWIGRRIVAVDTKYASGAAAGYAVSEALTKEAE